MSRGVVAIGGAALFAVMLAVPAAAEITGPCDGSAEWSDGLVVDAGDLDTGEVVVVPRTAIVTWVGSIALAEPPANPRPASGYVKIKLPWPLPQVTAGDWSDTGTSTGNSGSYDYDLPAVLAGFKVPITGKHWEGTLTATGDPTCSGSAVVQLEGTNPIGFVTGGFTVVALAGVFLSVRTRGPSAGGSLPRRTS